MRLHELPTHLLRTLAARCEGSNAASGDGRVALRAVASACYAEIGRRVEGADFPEISDEATAKFAAEIKSGIAEFARLIYEIEE
jgi:hypothetical protein